MSTSSATDDRAPPSQLSSESNKEIEKQQAAVTNDGTEETEPTHDVRFILAFTLICICQFQVALDLVIVASALPAIASSLNASSNEAYWCGTGFVLAQCITQPVYGTLSEIFGRKVPLLFAIFVFLLASILCARAEDIQWLITTRVIQGVGGGGLLTMCSIITADMTTLRERGKFISYTAMAYAVGCAVGTPVGAAFGEYSTWRWCFYINIPICVLCFVGIWFSLHLELETASCRERFWRIDWLGIFVFIGSAVSLLVGVTGGGVLDPWSSASTIVPLVIGGIGLCAFVFIEAFVSSRPMMPMGIFSDINAGIGFFNSFCHGFIILIVNYYLIIYFLGSQRYGLLHSAIDTMPVSVIVSPFAYIAGAVMAKKKKLRSLLWAGWALTVGGLAAFSTLGPSSNLGEKIGWQVIVAGGVGFLYSTIALLCQAGQPDELQSIAINIFTFFRSLGQTFGIAVGGVVFQNQFGQEVADYNIPAAYRVASRDAESAFAAIGTFPADISQDYRQIYAKSLQTLWYTGVGVAAVALLTSLLVRNTSLDRGMSSNQRFVSRGSAKEVEG